MVGGNLLLSIFILGIGGAFQSDAAEGVQIFLLCAIMFCFSLGPGPLTDVIENEITPLPMRARIVGTVLCSPVP